MAHSLRVALRTNGGILICIALVLGFAPSQFWEVFIRGGSDVTYFDDDDDDDDDEFDDAMDDTEQHENKDRDSSKAALSIAGPFAAIILGFFAALLFCLSVDPTPQSQRTTSSSPSPSRAQQQRRTPGLVTAGATATDTVAFAARSVEEGDAVLLLPYQRVGVAAVGAMFGALSLLDVILLPSASSSSSSSSSTLDDDDHHHEQHPSIKTSPLLVHLGFCLLLLAFNATALLLSFSRELTTSEDTRNIQHTPLAAAASTTSTAASYRNNRQPSSASSPQYSPSSSFSDDASQTLAKTSAAAIIADAAWVGGGGCGGGGGGGRGSGGGDGRYSNGDTVSSFVEEEEDDILVSGGNNTQRLLTEPLISSEDERNSGKASRSRTIDSVSTSASASKNSNRQGGRKQVKSEEEDCDDGNNSGSEEEEEDDDQEDKSEEEVGCEAGGEQGVFEWSGMKKNEEEDAEGKERGWADLLQLALPQRWWIASACLTLAVRLPFSLAVPHFVSAVLGAVIDGDGEKARYNVLCLLVVGSTDAVLDFWNFFLFGYAQQRLVKDLRNTLFGAILNQEVAFFDATTSGDLTSRLTSDTAEMSGDLTWVFRWTIESLIRIGGITAYMCIMEWRLALVALCLVPVLSWIGKLYGNWLQANARVVQAALADANANATEVLGQVRTVLTCGCEGSEKLRYAQAIQRYYVLNVRQTAMQAGYYMLVNTFLINTVLQAALLFYGSKLCLHGPEGDGRNKMHPQVLIAFMLYQGQLQEYTSNLVNSLTSLIKSTGAGAKVFALLEREPKKRPDQGFLPPPPSPPPPSPPPPASPPVDPVQPNTPQKQSSISGEIINHDEDNNSGNSRRNSSSTNPLLLPFGASSPLEHHHTEKNELEKEEEEEEEVFVDVVQKFGSVMDTTSSAAAAAAFFPGTASFSSSLGCHVQFNNAVFAYSSRPQQPVLKGLTFEALPGQTVALVGPSGAGKSTVFHLLGRLYEARSSTSVLLDGRPMCNYDLGWLRQTMALVSQEPVLFAGTIEANILYAFANTTPPQQLLDSSTQTQRLELRRKVTTAAGLANAAEFIGRLPHGYDTQVGEKGVQLSGGQKQRLAIARALMLNPRLLLLDEATSALDTQSERLVQQALSAVSKGRTTLVIAHRMATVRKADKIVVFGRSGCVVESGTHEELLAKEDKQELVIKEGGGHQQQENPQGSLAALADRALTYRDLVSMQQGRGNLE